jgi:sensor histidine kinase YesM
MYLYSAAQDPYVFPLGKDQGVETSTVYNIYQDTKGYVWFASETGLIQYDGNVSIQYSHPDYDAGAGTGIREDVYGRIWYTTFRGQIFYVENDTLHCLAIHKPSRFTPIGITKKYMFAFSDTDLHIYDLKDLRRVKTIKSTSDYIQHTTSDSAHFYYTQLHSVFKVDDDLQLSSVHLNARGSNSTYKVYSYGGKIYVLLIREHVNYLYVFDFDFKLLSTQLLPIEGSINDLVFYHDELFIIGSKGLDIFSISKEGIPEVSGSISMFKHENVSSMIKDIQGNYWISTLWGGVNMIPDIHNRRYQLPGEIPICLTGNKNNLWVSTHRGSIYTFDFRSSTLRNSYMNPRRDGIYFMHYDSLSRMLMYSSKGFYLLNTNTYRVVDYNQYAVKSIIRLDDNYLLAGTSLELVMMRSPVSSTPISSKWDSLFNSRRNDRSSVFSQLTHKVWIKSIAYDQQSHTAYAIEDNRLYRITPNGIARVNVSKRSIVFFDLCFHKHELYVLSADGEVYILIDGDLQLVPLLYQNKKVSVLKMKSFPQGLLFSTGNSLFLKSDGQQLQKIRIRSRDFTILDYYARGKDIILSTHDGIIKIPFSISVKEEYVPGFFIRSLMANGNPISIEGHQELSSDVDEIEIHFSLLDFSKRAHEDLFYQINSGVWVQIPAGQSRLIFPSLASGDYIIRFRASDVVFPQFISFTILKPLWRQPWFILILTLSIFLFVYIYYRWQVGILRNQIQLLNDKVQLEKDLGKMALTSIKSQMNPHFFYNALNTIQAYIFTNDKKNASGYLAKFSTLTRMILDMSEKEWVTLSEEVNALSLYLELENMRFTEKIQFEIKYNDLDTDGIRLPSMLIQPYVENAVKHGLLHKLKDRELKIVFYVQLEVLYIRIEDNGIGRQRAQEIRSTHSSGHASFSTKANERRLDILNRMRNRKVSVEFTDLRDSNGHASGTIVTLCIPIDIYGS